MAPTIPTTEPDELVAGDSWKWDRTLGDYPASEGWTLTYTFSGPDTSFTLTASADGDTHQIRETPASTAGYTPSPNWRVIGRVDDGTDKYTVFEEIMPIRSPGPALSHGETMIPLLESAIERLVANDNTEVDVLGRSWKKRDLPELRTLLGHYRAEVRRERKPDQLGRKVAVRF